jgi:transposase
MRPPMSSNWRFGKARLRLEGAVDAAVLTLVLQAAAMIGLPANTRIWIAGGVTDIRCGFNGPAAKVETALQADPFNDPVFVFRGRRGDIVKLLLWTGDGLCLLAKRLGQGRFKPARTWQPTSAS